MSMGKPKIRFQGYTEDWEQRKFGDDNDLITGYPFESEKFSEEGIKLVRGMNVKRGYLDFSNDICVRWNSTDGLENYLLEADDILIQMDGALIGKSYAKIAEEQLPALLVQRVTRARTRSKDACTDFMYQTIQRDFWRYIGMNKTETAVPHLSLNDIYNFKIMVPCLGEQQQIGAYFTNLDHLITLHQRKCDETKKLKKYMLQKMFPQNGHSVPEIRFSGFTEDWEQRKLEDMCSIITKQTGFDYSAKIKPSLVTSKETDTYSFIQNKDFEGMNINLDTDFYIPISVADKYPKITLDQPSLLISISGRIGNVGLYLLDSKAFIGGAVGICKLNDIEDGKTALYELLAPTGQKYFNSLIKASSHANITVEDIRQIEVLLPKNRDEKDKLNRFFENIDHLITLHQQKCEKLQKIKKFMLQNMFV